jgi:hypothetical protein
VYLATLSPTVNGGDSGELASVAALLGVAHPTGYPLHTLLGNALTFLPVGSVAWRVNLLSAIADACAALLLFRTVLLLTRDPAAGLLSAGAFAFAALVWPFAIVAEVFALNNFFAAGLLYWSARALRENAAGGAPMRTLVLATAWLTFGFSNHHTLVFFGIPFAALVLVLAGRRLRSPRVVAALAAAAAVGFLPYLHLPLSASRPAAVTWGDPTTWSGFVVHFLRREYGTFQLESSSGARAVLPRIALFWEAAARSTLFTVIPLGVAALASLRRAGVPRQFTGFWLIALLFYLVVFCSLANGPLDSPLHVALQERFWQQGFVVVSACLGLGLAELARLLRTSAGWLRWPVAAALPLTLVATNLPEARAHANTLVRDYSEAILRSVPPRGVLVITNDSVIGGTSYLRYVEGLRPDVTVVPTGILPLPWFRRMVARHEPDLVVPAGPFTFRQFLDLNQPRRPVVVCTTSSWMATLLEAYSLWPLGVVELVLPHGQKPEAAEFVRDNEASFARFDPSRAESFPAGSWEADLAWAYWNRFEGYGMTLVGMAASRWDDPVVLDSTVRALERLAARPVVAPLVLKNLGVAHHMRSRTHPEALEPMVREWRRYLAVAPQDDPDLPKIRTLVAEAERRTSVRATP